VPYAHHRELPESVRHVLPVPAQEIYLAAFNGAWDTYADADKRRAENTREEVAHKVAWSAVKRKYYKDRSGRWRRDYRSETD
jgi:cation transport regulator